MPNLTLYAIGGSPPCRATYLTLDALGLDYELKKVNLLEGEHLKPEFLKLNPQHTVPTLTDDDFSIYESKAINIYLTSMYDAKHILIPACKRKAAKVHQMLCFDECVLGQRFYPLLKARIYGGKKEPPSADEKKKLTEAMNYLEDYLKPTGFVAGTDTYSLADLTILATYSSMVMTGKVFLNFDDFPESRKWFDKMKELVPNYEKACGEGATEFRDFIKHKIESN